VSAPAVAAAPRLGRAAGHRLVADAVALSARMPDLVLAARKVAMTAIHGLHGRRRAGPGEDFWQYRHYGAGENAASIDWRRSGRDDHLYVREQEWESAHTVWLWVDRSVSMAVKSDLAETSKRDRAVVMTLALADMLVHMGERVGLLGLTRPIANRFVLDRFAEALVVAEAREGPGPSLPPRQAIARFCEAVVIGDLLDPAPDLGARLGVVAASGARAHLLQVLDPIEETFPFDGRTEFVDTEGGARFTAGRAEAFREEYLARLARHRAELAELARATGGAFLAHRTDRAATGTLLSLALRLAHAADIRAHAAEGAA
jgi:uncharacterized protein (DUF58 family)